ncbi:MAG: helix-turn-helix transcriptional regulator [Lachnospiraceae bacterium]|nr:helix-turn-helix transcriptional regulator [Lachnospiraceae bacterium]MBR5666635.1 helix-turn-helix transcriptional regulator [Lachnospiraceae bacterium]
MTGYDETEERRKRFAQVWSVSRQDAGKTQEEMAKGLGISKKTVQNWENGVTFPDLFTGCEWFRVLGMNPLPYYLAYLFPEFFDSIDPEDGDETIGEALDFLVQNLTAKEKRELLYLMAGRHGSPWYSLLQLFTAHCHLSMRGRVAVATQVLETYELEKSLGELVCPRNVAPDITILRDSVEQAKKSVVSRTKGYTTIVSRQNTGANDEKNR